VQASQSFKARELLCFVKEIIAMRRGAIRTIRWTARRAPVADRIGAPALSPVVAPAASASGPQRLVPQPKSAEEEVIALLRIAAEVEGALLAQYLFAAGSLLPGVSTTVAGVDHPILSDDWYDLIRNIAKQEMGHLITVQNLLLSLDAAPHLDRENFPLKSPLYPFPFSLQPIRLDTLAKYVCAEAPRDILDADKADYADAVSKAGAIIGNIPRAGQIYERLFWLFQDGDTPQAPWPGLQNPFPDWDNWHVDPNKVGFNQDRQASPSEWRGNDASEPPETAIYVLQVNDKASARQAIYAVGLQGEGPIEEQGVTHFDKFLRVYREQRAVAGQNNAPTFARNQADNPSTGVAGAATITNPTALAWAKLANTRYELLLMDIALTLSLGQTGAAPSTTATRKDFFGWAFREMLACIKPLSEELRQMPIGNDAGSGAPRAGIPFELPNQSLPINPSDQLSYLRGLIADSKQMRADIRNNLHPTPKQSGILTVMDNIDATITQKVGA
jgi:Ferritin-like